MHQVDLQPHQSAVTRQPCLTYVCPRTCDTASCADDDNRDAAGDNNRDYSGVNTKRVSTSGVVKRCSVSGQPCSSIECGEWCKGSGFGTTINDDWGTATSTNHH
jgi:hypothetical protein